MNILAFDIETVPDVETGRRLHDLGDLADADVARVLAMKRREQTGESEFLRHHLHRIVAIAAVLRHGDTVRVWSLGEATSDEAELIRRFYDGIERYTPTLVSWNGGGFDMPVLHYRALKHGIAAPRYWETGADDQSFRYNNYLNRFHERHTDLMDVLSGYQARATAPLDEIAVSLGLPGKMGRSGAAVWDQFLAGQIDEIRDYCETDALNTYLIYLRFELMRGNLDQTGWARECDLVRGVLQAADRPHWKAFLAAWNR
ncbi:MAG: 3'-5' exonuclease [Candidatus Muproteobacteria bacterium RBG_16_60_9]|uniref:3'-5' exonuclease n=1 Tax=Candidatus Muproteobacteria bacterium RBG_16_60_9 TaxID=1817755 RepID=A0A1F6VET4_9PROT|nr:MAG: 3'-5' exonuclease [Candidatus Muproteobacteria bacterium RBG_16_60_9]